MKSQFLSATVVSVCLLHTACTSQLTETEEGAPLARQVIESDQCGLGSGGLTYVSDRDELADVQLWPEQNLSMNLLEALNFNREHLLLVGLGQKPTGGFGITLADSQIVDGVLALTVYLRQPPAGAVVTQVLTTPCVVVAVSPDSWNRLEVHGNGLKSLELSR